VSLPAAWGNNGSGITNVPAGLSNVVAIASGYYHNLALRADGTIAAWGASSSGVLNVPPGLNDVVAIACGFYHNLALRADGTVIGWGLGREFRFFAVFGGASELGEAEFARYEIEHGDHVSG